MWTHYRMTSNYDKNTKPRATGTLVSHVLWKNNRKVVSVYVGILNPNRMHIRTIPANSHPDGPHPVRSLPKPAICFYFIFIIDRFELSGHYISCWKLFWQIYRCNCCIRFFVFVFFYWQIWTVKPLYKLLQAVKFRCHQHKGWDKAHSVSTFFWSLKSQLCTHREIYFWILLYQNKFGL